MTLRGSLAAAGLVGLILCASTPGRVLAHAVLLRTTPSGNQTLSQAPAEVRLLFSEPIDSVFSGIHVLNAAGQFVDRSDAHVDPADDHQLVVSLQPGLPNGVYTVTWRSFSTIDVHPDQGQYALFVGVPAVAPGALATGNVTSAASGTPETTLSRWWFYVAASLFGGVLAAWKLVAEPVLATGRAEVRAVVYRRAHRLIVVSGILLIVGTLFAAIAQAAAAADVPLLEAPGQPVADLLLRGRFAAIWWPRIGLEVASLLLVALGGLDGLAADCALATLPGVLLTSSLTSHGAAIAASPGAGIVVDWLHILGATAWIGGLISVLLWPPVMWSDDRAHAQAGPVLPQLLARFSRFALLASAIVALSGIVQAYFEVASWSALTATGYGQMVLVKVALLGGMLLLAGFNAWHARCRVVQQRVLQRSVWAELALGMLVFAVAAILTGTPPAQLALP